MFARLPLGVPGRWCAAMLGRSLRSNRNERPDLPAGAGGCRLMATERVSLCDMFAADGLRRSHVQWGGSISNPMMFVRTIYWLRACVLGLFVVAQVTGVIPLIYDHTLNMYETAPVAAHGHHHVKPTGRHGPL
jgi:hypothetical protein